MKTNHFPGLFEDEVADALRSAGPGSVIRSGLYSWRQAHTLCEDGVYSSGAGYYVEYIDGRRSGIVGAGSLVRRLSHTEFVIVEV